MLSKKIGVYGVFVVLVAVAFLAQGVYGLGITISQESILVPEGETGCVSYGIFNSAGEDISVQAVVSDGLSEFLDYTNPEVLDVSGNTEKGEAVPIEICFSVPVEIYDEDKSCLGEQKEFEGFITLVEGGEGSAGGSATSFGVKGELKLIAKCVPNPFNYALVLIITAIVLAIAIVVLLILKSRKKSVAPFVSAGSPPVSGSRSFSDTKSKSL